MEVHNLADALQQLKPREHSEDSLGAHSLTEADLDLRLEDVYAHCKASDGRSTISNRSRDNSTGNGQSLLNPRILDKDLEAEIDKIITEMKTGA